jgi:phenylacetate-coenzyme A ligase PaaK-like adenylate-forming protein
MVIGVQATGRASETLAGLRQALEGSDAWSNRRDFLSRHDSLSLFLAYAAENVPHYHRYFKSSTRRHLYCLEDFPLISREDLSSRLQEFLARSPAADSRLFAKTSGSTGRPLTVLFDLASWYDLNYETYAEVGRTIPSLLSHLSPGGLGVVLLTAEVNRHPASLVLLSLNCSVFERHALGVDQTRDLRLVQQLRRRRVPILYGKPTSLRRLAELDSTTRPTEGSIRPVVLLTSGENLFADVREALEEWFKCRVCDAYISVEGGLVAIQCPHTSAYHIQTHRVRLEVLGHDGSIDDEGAGELVLTNLSNWALPLVRYRTGDQGTLRRRCDCGHPLQTLVSLPAREIGLFRVLGDAVATKTLDSILLSRDVKQFQLVQVAPTDFNLTWIPSSAVLDRDEINEWLGRRLKQALGEVTLQVRAVESITRPGGKVRRYSCLIPAADSAGGSARREPGNRIVSGVVRQIIHYAALTDPALSLVIAIAGRELLTADMASAEPALRRLRAFHSKLTCGALSPDDATFAVADQKGAVYLFDINTGRTTGEIQGHRGSVSCVAFDAGGKRLVTGGIDGGLMISDSYTLVRSAATKIRGKSIVSLALSFDGMLLAVAGSDGRIRLWDALTLGHVCSFGGEHQILSLSFTPDGDALAGGCADNTVRLWDACSGRQLAVFRGHSGPVVALTFCPDAKTLVSGSLDSTVRLWHVWSGQHLSTLHGHAEGVRSLFVTKDGRTIVSGGEDGTVRLWPIVSTTDQ